MSQMQHPFLVGLVKTFQDDKFVYILLPMLQGGELFSVLHDRDQMGLPESQARFYALAVADALAYMHSRKCVYRDLKPENVMIDNEGYPVIVDFGFAKYVEDKTYTLCGTPSFVAPEVVTQRGHAFGADHWSLGILIYELVSSTNPFQYEGMDQIALFSAICQDDYEDPRGVSDTVIDLIRKLLVKDPNHRLGSLARGERDILEHGWFESLDLSAMRARQAPYVPWVPTVEDPLDTSNFDDWSHLQDKTAAAQESLSETSRRLFEIF
jgi:protein kinase A